MKDIADQISAWQIRIDGQDIRKVTLESLRKHIGVVPQDTVSLLKNHLSDALYVYLHIMHFKFSFKLDCMIFENCGLCAGIIQQYNIPQHSVWLSLIHSWRGLYMCNMLFMKYHALPSFSIMDRILVSFRYMVLPVKQRFMTLSWNFLKNTPHLLEKEA